MTLERYPLILAALIGLIGLALVLDGWLPDRPPRAERRRRVRRERSRPGELAIGLGTLLLAAAVAGRDGWRYAILATLVGTGLVLVGSWANRRYLRELLTSRGASRRRSDALQDTPAPGAPTVSPAGRDPAPPAGPPSTSTPVAEPAPRGGSGPPPQA